MDEPQALRFGLSTSTGGLPFADHATAVEFALNTQRRFPTVPRLRPGGTSLIDMVAAWLPGATTEEPGILNLTSSTVPLSELIGKAELRPPVGLSPLGSNGLSGAFSATRHLVDALAERQAALDDDFVGVRVNVLGPITTAFVLRSAGVPLDRAIIRGIEIASRTGAELGSALRAELRGKLVAVVLSEPGLIGSMHPAFALLSGQVHDSLNQVVMHIDQHLPSGPALIGVHVAGRADWPSVLASGASLVSAPVEGNLAGHAAQLQDFLDAGGNVAWGAVPVDEPLGTTDELLWRRLGGAWCSLVGAGVDPFQLRAQAMISTTGGLAHFGEPQARNALSLVDQLARRVKRQAVGTRLSLGA